MTAVMDKIHLNPLWCLWYILIALCAHGYLIYRAIRRLDSIQNVHWETDDYPHIQIYYYIIMIGVSLLCLMLFAVCNGIKIGNFASDGEKLGKLVVRVVKNGKIGTPGFLARLWRHFTPVGLLFHVISVFVLLLSMDIISAKLITSQHHPARRIFQSDLDFILGSEPLQISNLNNSATPAGDGSRTIYPEFCVYIAALFICLIRYPSVFWFTNKGFSVCFALFQGIGFVQQVFTYCGFIRLYFVIGNQRILAGNNIHIPIILPLGFCLLVYLLGATIVFLNSVLIFEYGHRHYFMFYKRCKEKYEGEANQQATTCYSYWPNILAMGSLILWAICKSPLIYDWLSVYRQTKSTLLLACIIVDAIYILSWIALWFFLTVKQQWAFHIQLPISPKHRFFDYQDSIGAISPNSFASNPDIFFTDEPHHHDLDPTEEIHQQEMNAVHQPDIETFEQAPPTLEEAPRRRVQFNEQIDTISPPSFHRDGSREGLTSSDESISDAVTPLRQLVMNEDDKQNYVMMMRAAGLPTDIPDDFGRPQQIDTENETTATPTGEQQDRVATVRPTYPISDSPENTLSRNYTDDIRNRCGQYYAKPSLKSPDVIPLSPLSDVTPKDRFIPLQHPPKCSPHRAHSFTLHDDNAVEKPEGRDSAFSSTSSDNGDPIILGPVQGHSRLCSEV